jgi:hypothetical protein
MCGNGGVVVKAAVLHKILLPVESREHHPTALMLSQN